MYSFFECRRTANHKQARITRLCVSKHPPTQRHPFQGPATSNPSMVANTERSLDSYSPSEKKLENQQATPSRCRGEIKNGEPGEKRKESNLRHMVERQAVLLYTLYMASVETLPALPKKKCFQKCHPNMRRPVRARQRPSGTNGTRISGDCSRLHVQASCHDLLAFPLEYHKAGFHAQSVDRRIISSDAAPLASPSLDLLTKFSTWPANIERKSQFLLASKTKLLPAADLEGSTEHEFAR